MFNLKTSRKAKVIKVLYSPSTHWGNLKAFINISFLYVFRALEGRDNNQGKAASRERQKGTGLICYSPTAKCPFAILLSRCSAQTQTPNLVHFKAFCLGGWATSSSCTTNFPCFKPAQTFDKSEQFHFCGVLLKAVREECNETRRKKMCQKEEKRGCQEKECVYVCLPNFGVGPTLLQVLPPSPPYVTLKGVQLLFKCVSPIIVYLQYIHRIQL